MESNVNLTDTLPEVAEKQTETDTIPNAENEVFIPVKYNKQTVNLNLEKAQEFAQKGMKFDAISKDYEALKELATAESKSVSEFINKLKSESFEKKKTELLEKCGGDESFAEHILTLENKPINDAKGFLELRECFPEVKSIEDLPESVVENAKLKGTLLLDEYLRYRHLQDVAVKESLLKQQQAIKSSTGSQLNKKGSENPETAEFLKGLWRK